MLMNAPKMGFRVVGDLFVLVHRSDSPDDRTWNAYLAELETRRTRFPFIRTLVYTLGGAPSAAQRARMNSTLAGRKTPAAVLSHSGFVRGVVTALAWFNPGIRAFAPERASDALRYLELAPKEDEVVFAAIDALCRELAVDAPDVRAGSAHA